MALYLIGIGLADATDITLKGLELCKLADKIYLETYTSILQCSEKEIEQVVKKKIILASREDIESGRIVDESVTQTVALLVAGDPLAATTHVELLLEAKHRGIATRVVHNASVISAISATGLQLYKFGKVISIPFQKTAELFIQDIAKNKSIGLHTLLLLDLEPSSGTFLTIPEAVLRLEQAGHAGTIIGCARLGTGNQLIVAGTPETLSATTWGKPPYCIVIPGTLHFKEQEALELWKP